ncbi:alpha/beta fold hydrolase [Cohnella sp. GCM10027633]|uniref:alpha/beta fold hydrolase n=1 Tax=unclassified Cohnella TaxID=2636738 RepID=UPI00364446D4
MKLVSKMTDSKGTAIHYLDSNPDGSLVPLLICPGLSETAEEYADLMAYLSPRRCVALSFRGRGRSGTPDAGYGLDEHIADIESVVDAVGLNRFHLFGYSRGVSYALGYAERHPSSVVSIIVQDYPAVHKQMPEGWDTGYIRNYLIPFSRQQNIRPEAVRGIQRESERYEFDFRTNKKLLVLRGMLEDSLLDEDDVRGYYRINPQAIVSEFPRSGHDIRHTDKDRLYREIGAFIGS